MIAKTTLRAQAAAQTFILISYSIFISLAHCPAAAMMSRIDSGTAHKPRRHIEVYKSDFVDSLR
jgi:hypothetical protein